MSGSEVNLAEQDLRTLIEPFKHPDKVPEPLTDKALELLDFVDNLVKSGQLEAIRPELWHNYLNLTGRSGYLVSLGSDKARSRWADLMFRIVDETDYTLLTMFEQRVNEHPERPFFRELDKQVSLWSYGHVFSYMKKIAAAFYSAAEEPRVLLYMENSPEGACTDLACLTFGILDSPVDKHFDRETISYIVKRLGINIVVTDTQARLQRLVDVEKQTGTPLKVFVTDPLNRGLRENDLYLGEACSFFSDEEAGKVLAIQAPRDRHAVSTVMFTSGSTGEPKGVAFTNYNLVSKRFARAAALPEVGHDEVLLSYLPLFHTFGRYLEMMGMLYWGGTYVFAGNTSRETFLKRFAEVQPTGLISIPLRWLQIQQHCVDQLQPNASPETEKGVFQSVVGSRLRWGLSAAGFLSAKTFRFFHRNRVALCSGFGMTESTGGITMTPPDDYVDNSVGIPLPGMAMRLTEQGELEIGGPYLARYLEQLNDEDPGKASFNARTELVWMKTGDLFQVSENGQYEIVDRIKDIYKNNRGQTVAPRRVEKKFNDVPGIKNAFLVGDARDYNVLLIVPDTEEQLTVNLTDEERDNYFQNIVTAANQELMPYERVVNIALLARDFDIDQGELTPKGSFRRKQVTKNFKHVIDELYVRNYAEFVCSGITVRVPRWFFRDLGVLETGDILCSRDGLYNKARDRFLTIRMTSDNIQVGDLEYAIKGAEIDLGLFARQPRLWAGNPALIAFCPCKEGWDTQLKGVAEHAFLPYRENAEQTVRKGVSKRISNPRLRYANDLFNDALYREEPIAIAAIDKLDELLGNPDERLTSLVRNRLQALARHPVENIRCHAYSVILFNSPLPDYRRVYPAFLNSGLSFLNDEFINRIGQRTIERRRLEALRLRMLHYRRHLDWPVKPVVADQIGKLLELMADFARSNPDYFYAIRGEMASWAVQMTQADLMEKAESLLVGLTDWYEKRLPPGYDLHEADDWHERMEFEEGISAYEIKRLNKAIVQTTFLYKSIVLAFDDFSFDLMNVPVGGIWFSRLLSQRGRNVYRVSINTSGGNHYELMVILREDYADQPVRKVLFWLMAISDHPFGPGTLPRMGCHRDDLGVLSVAYVNDLTAWERIREYTGVRANIFTRTSPGFLKNLFIRAMAAFFAACRNSGYQIVPGQLSPSNVAVVEPDYRSDAMLLSLGGSKDYDGPLSFVRSLVKNFYHQTAMHYPWSKTTLDESWIFDACVEGLGAEEGHEFLAKLDSELSGQKSASEEILSAKLSAYLKNYHARYYVPIALWGAIRRYGQWLEVNPKATPGARENFIDTLYQLYRVDRFGEIARYYMYRHTYFADASKEVCSAFDFLLGVLHENPEMAAISSPALSALQATLNERVDRQVFGHLVFPRTREVPDLEILAIGDRSIKQVVIKSSVTGRNGTNYFVREATEPSEIGKLYRLFTGQRYSKKISENDRFLVLVDDIDRLVGGICYQVESERVVYLDGIVVAEQLQGNGLGSVLVEDFCMRMSNLGVETVRTHFYRRRFYLKRSFQTDKRWGGLVRFLQTESEDVSKAESHAGER